MADSDQFSPYKSPGAACVKETRKTGAGGLTGHVRKVKDMAADIHNTLNKWETLNTQGHAILNDVVNGKIQFIYQQDNDDETDQEPMCAKTLAEKLEPKCQALQLTLESMEDVVGKLSALKSMVQGIRSLCEHRGDDAEILFTSWTIHHFVETVEALHAMYAKELSLKKQLGQNVAFEDTRSKLMVYSAAWLHQPYIPDSKTLVAALLQETGHVS